MECTVPVEIRLASEHADVGSLERAVSMALAEVGTRLWAELIGRLEAALAVPVECSLCGGPMKANGRAPRRPVTLSGEVEIRRRRFRCTLCGAEAVPLDAARAAETEALLGAHPDRHREVDRRGGTVWVSADGTMVHDRASGTELEVKVGLVFDGARRIGRTRRALTNRTRRWHGNLDRLCRALRGPLYPPRGL
jgi:hypothetical protein